MSKIIVYSSSNRDEREIDKYHDKSNTSGRDSESDSSCSSSSGWGGGVGDTTVEQYSSGVPAVPIEVFQEEIRMRAAFRSSASPSTNAPSSIPSPSEKEKILYCCVMGVSSKIDKKKLTSFRGWYRILDNLNTRLAALGE